MFAFRRHHFIKRARETLITMWVTMTEDGPQMGNIALKGLFDRKGLDPELFGAYDRKGQKK